MAHKKGKKEALGKGIEAIFGEMNMEDSLFGGLKSKKQAVHSINEIPLEQIVVNPFQPRIDFNQDALQELSKSIEIHGVVQPITVRQLDTDEYQLIAGERRLKASKLAGLEKIPAYIRTANDQEMLEIALIENIQRQDLNPMEMASTYQRLKEECSLSDYELGERLGKRRSTITNYIGLLRLPPEIQLSLKERKLSMGHAKTLVAIEEVDIQLALHKEILEKGLSVRATESLVRAMKNKKAPKAPTQLAPFYQSIQDRISSRLESKVELKRDKKGKGKLTISFTSDEELSRILEMIEEQR